MAMSEMRKFPNFYTDKDRKALFTLCEKETNDSSVVKMGHLVTSIFLEKIL